MGNYDKGPRIALTRILGLLDYFLLIKTAHNNPIAITPNRFNPLGIICKMLIPTTLR